MHGFTYECLNNTRSKDLFGTDIDAALVAGGDTTAPAVDIHALASVLVAAYSDLVINGNDDMPSYLYLTKQAKFALSEEVKNVIGYLKDDGGVALALVTELVATAESGEELFKKAVQPRNDDDELVGIEALNEANIQKVYVAITPAIQTKGVLLSNGVTDFSENSWASKIVSAAPNLDDLVNKKFDELKELMEEIPATATGGTKLLERMYAGLIGNPATTEVPPVRGYLLENGVSLQYAKQMEEVREELI